MPLRASAGVSESAPAAPLHVYSSSDCSTMRLPVAAGPWAHTQQAPQLQCNMLYVYSLSDCSTMRLPLAADPWAHSRIAARLAV